MARPEPDRPTIDLTTTLNLISRAQGGDRLALDELTERYLPRVRAVVRVRMGEGLRRWCDSGDILQQTFAAAVRDLGAFEPRSDAALLHWLAKIAENQIREVADHMTAARRDAGRDVSLEDPAAARALLEPAAAEAGPRESAERREEQRILERALARLPDEYRELVVLRDYIGFSWAEIAEQTGGPSADAARMRYGTARARLTVLVQEERSS